MAEPRMLVPLLAALVASAPAAAQSKVDPAQQRLIKLRDKKLASPFIGKSGFATTFAAAQKEAAQSKRLIFAYYTRSFAP